MSLIARELLYSRTQITHLLMPGRVSIPCCKLFDWQLFVDAGIQKCLCFESRCWCGVSACRLFVRDKRIQKSQVKENSKNPKWNEDFKFLVHEPDYQVHPSPLSMPMAFRCHANICRSLPAVARLSMMLHQRACKHLCIACSPSSPWPSPQRLPPRRLCSAVQAPERGWQLLGGGAGPL